jgi:hypothetical protein
MKHSGAVRWTWLPNKALQLTVDVARVSWKKEWRNLPS